MRPTATPSTTLPTSVPTSAPSAFPSASPTTANSLLDPGVHRQTQRRDENLAYCFEGDTGLYIAAAPPLPEDFELELEFQLDVGSQGYLFSKGPADGSRFFGLYVRPGSLGIRVYYMVRGGDGRQRAVDLAGLVVNDGRRYNIVFTVSANTLLVDTNRRDQPGQGSGYERIGEPFVVELEGPVGDCGLPALNCLTHVGQRVGGYATDGCFFAGILRHVGQFVTGPTITSTTTATHFSLISYLDPSVHLGPQRSDEDGAYCFFTLQGLRVGGAPLLPARFTMVLDFLISPTSGGGALFSKGPADGNSYFAIYVEPNNGGLRIDYRARSGVSGQRHSLEFPGIVVTDNNRHRLVIQVSEESIAVELDQTARHFSRLVGSIDDCGEPDNDCQTYVGQVAGAAEGGALDGCVYTAAISFAGELAITQEPSSDDESDAVNLLDPRNHDRAVEPSAGGGYCFDEVGIQLQTFTVTQTFTVAMALRLPTTAFGYLVSKGGQGASRYWALYSSRDTQTPVFYYRTPGSSVQRSVTFEVRP